MIEFTTSNSRYRVMCLAGKFHVTKIEEINPESQFARVGQTFISDWMSLLVGQSARFQGLYTSTVTSIKDSPPCKEGVC